MLTNLEGVQDSESLGWIMQIYLTRWKIEETFRFVKRSYNVEDIRALRRQRLKNLVLRVAAAAYLAAIFLGQKLKLKILCEKRSIISRCFFAFRPSASTRWPKASSKFSQGAAPTRKPNRLLIYNWNRCRTGSHKK
ncbi:MAG: transposase [Terriglobia bacterium]